MMTALVGSIVVRACKGLKDKEFTYRCRDPRCNGEVILVCSDRFISGQTHDVRTVHFRHKHQCGCTYCNGEGQWHREWKSHFDRVEVRFPDFANGELNIADAVVGSNFVLEFQHYHIALAEADAREAAYRPNGGMLWVLDANHRNTLAKLRDAEAKKGVFAHCTVTDQPDHYEVDDPVAIFPEEWTRRTVAVVFDYGPDRPLIRLYPGRTKEGKAIVQKIDKARLIEELKADSLRFAKSAGDFEKPVYIDPMQNPSPHVVVRHPVPASRVTTRLVPTSKPYVYRDTSGRLYSDYYGELLPLTEKFARAIEKSERKKAYYAAKYSSRRRRRL